MGHTEGLEEIKGEKAWRARAVTKDFLEEEAFSWALKDEKDLEAPCVRMDAEKRKNNTWRRNKWAPV